MLTPDRWTRLETLFTAAVDLPAAEREAFVARATTDHPDLRDELSGMLAHASCGSSRIVSVIADMAGRAMPAGNYVGRHFGPYRIVREIGRGGMGLVFEAVRDDDEYRKTVAIKLAPWWRDGAIVMQRFRLERQILADLDHPNIARFLDGGTADGLPYVVMEYVDGLPITAYCQGEGLGTAARIALFRQVCGAVEFAHQNLVVHRDLKPANILVAEHGVPKLLDFGIAKLMDPMVDGTVTAIGASMWTPDYASPEQVRARPVSTRTDVYQLGLVLYELLTGERAQVADQSSPLALDRSICDLEIPPPSERLEAGGRRLEGRRLRGDLDTIVMTALRKEPDRRYGSAAALNDDLARYLEGRPILARPSTVRYRALKFLRRHRVAAAVAALIVASLGAGLGATLYEARRAERHFEQVRALANTFVFDIHDRIASLPGSTEARSAIVRTALTYLEALKADAGGDETLARELAAAYYKVGQVQGNPMVSNLGDTAGALVSFERAAELLEPLVRRGDRAARLQLVMMGQRTAAIRQAQGDLKAALAASATAAEIGERLVAESPTDQQALSALGDVYAERARRANTLRDAAGAAQESEKAMHVAERLRALDRGNLEYLLNVSTAHNAVGAARMAAGRLEAAADSFRAAIAIREQAVAEQPADKEHRRNLLIAYGNLGDVLGFRPGQNVGDGAGAIVAFEKAVELAETATVSDPVDRRATFDLANAKLRLGSMLAEEPTRREAGLRELQEAERLNATLLAAEPGSARYQYTGVVIGRRIGNALGAIGRTAEAARRLEAVRSAAVPLLSTPSGPNTRVQLMMATTRLAALYARAGDARALQLADLATADLAGKPLDATVVDAQVYGDLGRVYLEMARRATGAARRERCAAATAAFEKSAGKWRTATLPKALEGSRTEALAELETGLLACRPAP